MILAPSSCFGHKSWYHGVDGRCRMEFALGQGSSTLSCHALLGTNTSSRGIDQRDEGRLTFRKYLFGLPSGKMTETFAVFVQADIPQVSAETTFVPLGMTEEL